MIEMSNPISGIWNSQLNTSGIRIDGYYKNSQFQGFGKLPNLVYNGTQCEHVGGPQV